MDIIQALRDELDAAQSELSESEVALLEIQARATTARTAVERLTAAIAAMEGSGSQAAPAPKEEPPPERPKRPQAKSNNPFHDVRCGGCGKTGSLRQSIVSTGSGKAIPMAVCGECGNQMPLGL